MSTRGRVAGMLGGLALLMSGGAMAQEAGPRESAPLRAGVGYFSVGVRWLDTGALTDRLLAATRNYEVTPEADDPFLIIGGGGHRLRGRWLFGGEGYGFLRREVARSDAFRVRLSGGYGLFRAGYALVSTRRLSVYALGGLGGGGVSVSISPSQSVTFDELLENPERKVTLERGMLLFDLGVGADYRLLLGGGEGDKPSFVHLGLRAGWLFAPFSSSWEALGDDFSGPDFGLGGPGATLSVGFGRLRSGR